MDFDTFLLLTLLVFFAANLVQGFTGFGLGIVAITGLTLIGEIVHATILVNLAGMITVSIVFWPLCRHAAWRHLWPLVVGIACSNPLGLALLKAFGPTHPELVRRILGVVILGFSAWSLWAPAPKVRTPRWYLGLLAGLVGGVLGGAFTMSGPALVAYLYSLPLSRDSMKASVNVCFMFNGAYRLLLLASAGDINGPTLVQFAYCVPAVLAGAGLGMVLARGVSTERFRRIAWTVFAVLGVMLIAR